MKGLSLFLFAVAVACALTVAPVQENALAGSGLAAAGPGTGSFHASPGSAALLWQAPTAVPQGTGAGPGTSAFGPPTPGPCSTGPMVPLCSTLGIPMCTSGGGMFCSVNVQGTRCSAGGNGVCSASNMNTGVGGAKCSVRGPAVPGAPPSFCSTVGGICSSINGGDCSVQMESLGHCSVIQGAGGVCTTFDNMSLCSIRPDPTGVGGPGTCSTLLPNGSVGGGMICSG